MNYCYTGESLFYSLMVAYVNYIINLGINKDIHKNNIIYSKCNSVKT